MQSIAQFAVFVKRNFKNIIALLLLLDPLPIHILYAGIRLISVMVSSIARRFLPPTNKGLR